MQGRNYFTVANFWKTVEYIKPAVCYIFNISTAQGNRKVTSFDANKAPSLELSDVCHSAAQEDLRKEFVRLHKKQLIADNADDITKLELQKVELVQNNIIEHAARRVDLFFYLLIAVYGKYVHVTKDKTKKQNGVGDSDLGTQACHCSLFPNIKIETLYNVWSMFAGKFNIQNTYFEDVMNMTTELPKIVNGFDGSLEGRRAHSQYIQLMTEIINKVAKNDMDPSQGMEEFFSIMKRFFDDYEEKHFKSKNTTTRQKNKNKAITNNQALLKVWECEKNGTFFGNVEYDATLKKFQLNRSYLYTILRLDVGEQYQVEANPKLLPAFYRRIQCEILTSKPVRNSSINKQLSA